MTERRWTLPENRKPLTRKQRIVLFLRQDGRCPNCGQKLETKGSQPVAVDEHLNPLWRGGSNDLTNRELWCVPCTKPKTAIEATQRAKSNKLIGKAAGLKSRRPIYQGKFKRKMDGTVVDRETGEIVSRGRR